MAGASVRITGVDRLGVVVTASLYGASDASRTKLARQLGVLALREEASYFSAQASPAGVPWKPHSPVTTARRRTGKKKGRANRILADSGALRLSVTPGSASTFDSGARGAFRRADMHGFAFGSALNYAAAHQYGRAPIKGVRQTVDQYRRRAYVRKDGARVKAAVVRAHVRVVTLPAIPARPFVGFSNRLVDRMFEVVRRGMLPES